MNGNVGMSGELATVVNRHRPPAEIKEIRLPFGWGRVAWSKDLGESQTWFAKNKFQTNLQALHLSPAGNLIKNYNLGSGLVTNVGVMAMANDALWAAPSGAAVNTLATQNFVGTGIGTNAATVNDLMLQSPAAPTTTTYVSGAQSLVSAASVQIYRQVTTVNYVSSLAITEWGLFSASAASVTLGSPFTNTSVTSGTVTGTPYTASSTTVKGEQQLIVQNLTTGVYGLIVSNSTSVLTIPAWYNIVGGGAGSTPGNTAFSILPVMWDRKVFAAINVNSGDSIAFTYSLTIVDGG